jgi:hypothetical protein
VHGLRGERLCRVTNHVEPHEGDMMPFSNSEQWQPACKWHDDLVEQLLELMLARGELRSLISGSEAQLRSGSRCRWSIQTGI